MFDGFGPLKEIALVAEFFLWRMNLFINYAREAGNLNCNLILIKF